MKVQKTKLEIASLITQLEDMFLIYLENDIAGDNADRRNKLQAVIDIKKILRTK